MELTIEQINEMVAKAIKENQSITQPVKETIPRCIVNDCDNHVEDQILFVDSKGVSMKYACKEHIKVYKRLGIW